MEKQQINEELNKLKKEVLDLKKELNDINSEKEKWFKKKEELKKTIFSKITEIKKIKLDKDKSNVSFVRIKDERDKCNDEVRGLISEFKKLDSEKKKLFDKYGIQKGNESIREKIDQLEMKIETEALSIGQEKKVMREIKDLKKKHKTYDAVDNVVAKSKDISGKIDENKKKSEELHAKLIDLSKNNKDYKNFIVVSKDINDLKKEQEDAFSKFLKLKDRFLKLNEDLKKKLSQSNEYRKKLGDLFEKDKLKTRRKEESVLEIKAKDVEEKIKSKKKLTTDDLLVFQGKK